MTSQSDPPADVGRPPDALPQEGDVIAGKYRVERILGKGGMGVVVAARDLTLRRLVAIKVMLSDANTLPDAVARFLREAQSTAALQSEHVARLIDVGTLDSGMPFMVMEHLNGSDLGMLIRKRGRFPIADAVSYILQACEAIAEAHSLGIVHRDLKPGNLFLAARVDGSAIVKVLDFGLSKAMKTEHSGSQEASLTATATVVGSPFYMSPEQLRSLKHADVRTDIWALGVILYELISGARPFRGESISETLVKVVADEPASLRAACPEVPPELEAIIFQCLEKRPERRIQTVSELARALAPYGTSASRVSVDRIVRVLSDELTEPVDKPRAPQQAATFDASETTATPSVWWKTRARPRKSAVFVGAAGALVAGIAVFTAVNASWLRASDDPADPSGAAPARETAPSSLPLPVGEPQGSVVPAGGPIVQVSAAPTAEVTPAAPLLSAVGAGSAAEAPGPSEAREGSRTSPASSDQSRKRSPSPAPAATIKAVKSSQPSPTAPTKPAPAKPRRDEPEPWE
jgi:serine/threonine protein kinase